MEALMISNGDNAIHHFNEIDSNPRKKELTILNCGYYCAINSSYKINIVDSYMFLYLHKGDATVSVDKIKYNIDAGTTVLLKNSHINHINYHNNAVNERYYI